MRPQFVLNLICGLFCLSGMARGEDRYFDSGGVKIRYFVAGGGEPVLLIHGFASNLQMQWELPGIIQSLSAEYQVIAFDSRGHGKSGKPHASEKYGREMVEDAVRLLDHLGIEKAHVVGYSMGGMIASKLVTTHPNRVHSAVLGGSGGLREGEDPTLFHQVAESLEQGRGIGLLIEAITPAGRAKPTEQQIAAVNALIAMINDTKALAAVVRGFEELAVADDELSSTRIPMLAVIGADDPLKKDVDGLKNRMAHLEVLVIENADHMTAFASPAFRKALCGFLARQRLTADVSLDRIAEVK